LNDIPIGVLLGVLIFLILLSACFSGSETGMMTLNRYRLRHLAKAGHPGAMRAQALLNRTDRLIGLILIFNNIVNNTAAVIAGIIGLRISGDWGVAIATGLLTLVLLIFGEVAPKTLAALHPERIAFPASFVLTPMLKIFYYPIVLPINVLANGVLKLLGISPEDTQKHHLSNEELRTVVIEAGAMIPRRHQRMLLSILDLEKVTVEDIMVPRSEIVGIDLEDEWAQIVAQLTSTEHTRLLVTSGGVENVLGILHMRHAARLIAREDFNKDTILEIMHDPYFVPEGTPLNTQLLNFQRQQQRIALVVDEYGDIRGLVALEDILEEIVGEFTSDPANNIRDVHPQDDGTYLVDGSATVRDLNRTMHWSLPTDGPKTLNGLILEHLEAIPEPGISLMLAGYAIEIIQTSANAVKMAKISPALAGLKSEESQP
jgi:Mg2+/Co2+ transporter CorB